MKTCIHLWIRSGWYLDIFSLLAPAEMQMLRLMDVVDTIWSIKRKTAPMGRTACWYKARLPGKYACVAFWMRETPCGLVEGVLSRMKSADSRNHKNQENYSLRDTQRRFWPDTVERCCLASGSLFSVPSIFFLVLSTHTQTVGRFVQWRN